LKEFTQTLYTIADDVYMHIVFNPDYVKEYRLIGFDNKVGAIADSLSVIEGGEIGSGQSLMAVFEIVPTLLNEGSAEKNITNQDFVEVRLLYKLPNNNVAMEFKASNPFIFTPFDELDKCYRFSSAVIMFGSLIRSSQFVKNISWNDVLAVASESFDPKDTSQKEFISLVKQAKMVYSRKKKKKSELVN